MAVSEMNFISMIGPLEKINDIVNICGKSGAFQPDNVFSFYSNTDGFSNISDENPFSEPLQKLKNAVYSCGANLTRVDVSSFHVNISKIDRYVAWISKSIDDLIDKKRSFYQILNDNKDEIELLKHFYGLEKPISDIKACEYSIPRFGKIPIDSNDKLIKLQNDVEKDGIDLVFFPFETTDEYQWGIYFADIQNAKETDRLFASLYFEEVNIKSYDKNPYEAVSELQNINQSIYKKIEKINKEISDLWESQKSQCMKFYTKLQELSTYFEIKTYAAQYGKSFILVGWVPKENLKDFTEKISLIPGMEYTTEKGENILNHLPPVKLKNKKIFKPFEFFVDTYGMPSYNEVDPTAFVAITYNILFGIMFADLGQGLIVSLVGYLMWKLKKMKLGKILISCGFFSALFGIIFGSVFGFEHALDPFYKEVFGLAEKPIEVMHSQTTNMIIYTAVGIGIFLLILAMLFGIYSQVKRKNYGEAIFGANGFCGIIFYGSTVYMLLDMLIIHSGIVGFAYILGCVIIPLICLMFSELLIKLVNGRKDWKPDSWGDYLAQSFFELFEVVLSYVTNTMSFLRVGAFVLVHAGMMTVVFTIAEMFGGMGYVVALVIGNVFVIALEALLAGIQVLRLEFYEIFSRFFEGQGRAFTPVVVEDSTN